MAWAGKTNAARFHIVSVIPSLCKSIDTVPDKKQGHQGIAKNKKFPA
jgi:hypothetical protein